MQTMTQQQALDLLPDDDMWEKVVTYIINTPPSDFTELDKLLAEDEERYLASLTPEQREKATAWRRSRAC